MVKSDTSEFEAFVAEENVRLLPWQTAFCANDTLPITIWLDVDGGAPCTVEEVLRAWNITLLGPINGLYRRAVLPEGWTKAPNNECAARANLLDVNGGVRGHVYRCDVAADRNNRVTLGLYRRFSYTTFENKDNGWVYGRVWDHGRGPNSAHVIEFKNDHAGTYKDMCVVRATVRSQCIAWLDEHYPGWRDPRLHW